MKTLRGERSVSRLEALSDAVFAFSATLLVVSLEVPATFAELAGKLQGFLAFAMSFAALLMIWSVHSAYFRRYALQDRWTIVLNSGLLFVVLFYVYPLKFVTLGISTSVFGIGPESATRINGFDELAQIFMLYGLGFAAIFASFALMYRHANSRRAELALSDEECFEARFLFRHYLIFACVGLLSVAVAATRVGIEVALPGWLYGVLGPTLGWHGWWSRRKHPAVKP